MLYVGRQPSKKNNIGGPLNLMLVRKNQVEIFHIRLNGMQHEITST